MPKQPPLSQTPPELAVQAMFDPATVTYGSGTKLVWKCAAQGHQWEATVNSRTGKGITGRPVYSNRQVLAGFNDLETAHPDIAWESDFDPMTGIAGRHSKRPWKCAPPPDINGQQSSVIGPVATRVGALCVLMRGPSLGTLSGST